MNSVLPSAVDKLEDQYTAALQSFLAQGGESALQQAYELGRRALAEGLGVWEMAALYHKALETALARAERATDMEKFFRAGQHFFVESLSPFEMAHRGYRDANMALRGLNQRLEEEAKRIAHALHDEAGQLLASVYIALDEATLDLPSRDSDRFKNVIKLLDQIEGQLRRIAHELRPTILDDLGLGPALEFLAEGVAARSKIHVALDVTIQERLPTSMETILYRSVQEALTNATKHAKATRVNICLERVDCTVRCSISDNGTGFDPSNALGTKGKGGLGLMGIRERLDPIKGSLTITSKAGQGTTLTLSIPCEQ
jgi:signal transduction histidine kinase